MSNQEIEKLLEESEAPCISIVVPTHRLSPDRIIDAKIMEEAVKRTKALIVQKYAQNGSIVAALIEKIDDVVAQIDYFHLKEGIGIYVSPKVSKTILFPFNVVEKVKVGDKFDSRDLLYYESNIIDYYVLSITKEHIHLFLGKGPELHELKDENFPIDYKEEYEYSRSSHGTSFGSGGVLKNFEKDKSVLEEIRLIDFLRKADHLLSKYIGINVPFIVAGGKKEIADYLKISIHSKSIIGSVKINYKIEGDMQLFHHAWAQVQNHLKYQKTILISKIRELLGINLLAIGVEEVWKASKEGKGLELVIEKDFETKGFVGEGGYEVKLHKPSDNKQFVFVSDVVEKIIKTVREKNGNVVFVNDGAMTDFGGIALELRYSSVPD